LLYIYIYIYIYILQTIAKLYTNRRASNAIYIFSSFFLRRYQNKKNKKMLGLLQNACQLVTKKTKKKKKEYLPAITRPTAQP
jgi:hypothetical protein